MGKQAEPSKFDLIEQASTYGSYHHHPMYANPATGLFVFDYSCTFSNRAIHFIFVPAIIYAVFLWLAFLPLPFAIPYPPQLVKYFPLAFGSTWALPVAVIWGVYTMILEPFVGFLLVVSFLALVGLSNATYLMYGMRDSLYIGLLCHIVGWGMQIVVGHNYFEGRKPALMDSLFQVFVSPFFLVLEALFIFNYRPALYQQVEKAIEQKISAYKKSLQKKSK